MIPNRFPYTAKVSFITAIQKKQMVLSPTTKNLRWPCDESRSNARDVDGWLSVDWDTCAFQANPDLPAFEKNDYPDIPYEKYEKIHPNVC